MKKKVIGMGLGALLLLTGCEETMIRYKGETLPTGEVEEKIADELEVENSSVDLEVDIYTESDD
jgi:hypothetical protein